MNNTHMWSVNATNRFVLSMAVLSLCATILILMGWVLGITAFLPIIPGFISVKANAALSLACVACGILALLNKEQGRMRWFVYGAGAVVLILSVSVLLEYLFNWNSGLDEMFIRDTVGASFSAGPGRMALTTALSLFFMGTALTLYDVPQKGMVIDLLLLTAMLIALYGMLSTIYEMDMVIGIEKTSRMSQTTALLVFAECMALIAARPAAGIMRLLESHTAAAIVTRIFLPAAFLIPIGAVWLHSAGARAGLFTTYNGVAFIAFFNSALFIIVVISSARWIARAGERLRDRERMFSTIIENNTDGIAFIDAEGRTTFPTKSTHTILGYGAAEFEGRNLFEIMHPDDQQRARNRLMSIAAVPSSIFTDEFRVWHKDGRWIWVETRIRNLLYEPEVNAIVVNYHDITESKIVHDALVASEQLQRLVLDNIDDVIVQVPMTDPSQIRGIAIFLNRTIERRLGFTIEEFNNDPALWPSLIHPEDISKIIKTGLDVQREKTSITYAYRQRDKSGTYHWLEDCASPQLDAEGNFSGLFVVSRDVTDRMNAEEMVRSAEQRYRVIFENAVEGIFQTTPDGKLLSANPALASMYGAHSAEELIEMVSDIKGQIFVDPDRRNEFQRLIERDGVVRGFEYEARRLDGSTTWMLENTRAVRDVNGTIIYYEGEVQDIGDRKRAENRLRETLREKEVLVKEIHHRVKNNLQVISSLLNLQSASVVNERDREFFLESQNRVRSMALVHELLYRSHDLAHVDLDTFIRELSRTLVDTLAIDSVRIRVALDLESVLLEVENAIPIGLCINEIFTNAIKHAFPDGRSGIVTIQVKALDEGRFRVSVSDNGVGFIPPPNVSQSATLGLQLVSTLTEQIGGTLSIESGERTTITITANS